MTTFAEAVAAHEQQVCSKVEIWSQPTKGHAPAWLAELPITAGTVTEDETQIIRRTANFTAFDPTGSLSIGDATDLLHPQAGTELRAFRGLVIDGVPVWKPCGVYRVSNPQVQQDQNGIVISGTFNDRMEVLQQAGWYSPRLVTGNLGAKLFELCNEMFPGLEYDWTTTNHEIMPVVFGGIGTRNQGSDPATDLTTLAASGGKMFYFDETGRPTLVDIARPPTAISHTWLSGAGCPFSEADKSFDRSKDFNVVVVEGSNSSASTPLRAVLYVPPKPVPPRVFSYQGSAFKTQEQITAAAFGFLYRLYRASETQNGQVVPDPRVHASDLASLYFPALKTRGTYTITSVQMPLDPASSMQIACRPALVAGMPVSVGGGEGL